MYKPRKPLQGVLNVIRFNWHFYVLSFATVLISITLVSITGNPYNYVIGLFGALTAISTLLSLVISWYVYDYSKLYSFEWLQVKTELSAKLLNVNAGFDETSEIVKQIFPGRELHIVDFYGLISDAEISIKRARKAYQPLPGTIHIQTPVLPFAKGSIDYILVILSAHEIRDDEQRVQFFQELRRVVSDQGSIAITEHIRDAANFFAYNIGVFHFFSRKTWIKTFSKAGLEVASEMKLTPYITTFLLRKDGSVS